MQRSRSFQERELCASEVLCLLLSIIFFPIDEIFFSRHLLLIEICFISIISTKVIIEISARIVLVFIITVYIVHNDCGSNEKTDPVVVVVFLSFIIVLAG